MTSSTSDVADQLPIALPLGAMEEFCRKWQVAELALFGSVLRPEFRAASDVDVLVGFREEAQPTLLTLARMEGELEQILGRPVDLIERKGVETMTNPYFRRSILDSARVVYAR